MLHSLRTTRSVAWVVALAMAVAMSANCFAADDMTPAQKACCAAMAHDCGTTAIEQGCCASTAPTLDSLTAIAPAAAPPPAATLVAVLDLSISLSGPTGLFNGAVHIPVKPPGVPTYLLSSTFRI